MRSLIFILLLLPSLAFAQLSGKYCASGYIDEGARCFTFHADSGFEYLEGYTSTNHNISIENYSSGQGHYKIDGNSVLLFFELDTGYNYRTQIISDTGKPSLSPKSIVQLSVFSAKDSEGIYGVNLSTNRDSGRYNTLGTTNLDGNVELSLPRTKGILNLTISYLGFKELSFPIDVSNDYIIKVYLKEQKGKEIQPGSEWRYLIKKTSEKLLVLKSLDGHSGGRYKKER
jgi:hypothetical protein